MNYHALFSVFVLFGCTADRAEQQRFDVAEASSAVCSQFRDIEEEIKTKYNNGTRLELLSVTVLDDGRVRVVYRMGKTEKDVFLTRAEPNKTYNGEIAIPILIEGYRCPGYGYPEVPPKTDNGRDWTVEEKRFRIQIRMGT